MGIPLLRGRTFLAAETASTSVVIDRLAAARLFPSGDALGKRILLASDSAGARPLQVAGIVGTVREHIVGRDEAPHVYFPLGPDAPANLHIHLKAANDAALLDIVRREIHAFDPGLPVLALRTMRQHLDGSVDLWITRTAATLFSIFAGVALLLAAIGLYGVRSFAVARRTREIGIRMALGATAADTLRLVLREGAELSAIGAGTGLALSFLLGKVLAGLLFEVSPSDPAVFLTAPAILTAVSLAACYLPARRAARIDPMVALRDE